MPKNLHIFLGFTLALLTSHQTRVFAVERDAVALATASITKDELKAHIDVLADDAPSAERVAGGLGMRRALRDGLARLAPRAAEAFVLRHLEGLSNSEVAAALGTSAPVVAVTLHRARRSLQKHLTSALGERS